MAVVLGALFFGAPAALAINDPVLAGSVSSSTALSGATQVAVSGTWAYTTAYSAGRLTAIDILDPAHPLVGGQSAFSSTLVNSTNVAISGGLAYVVSKNRNASASNNDDGTGNSLTILDIATDPAIPTIVGSIHNTNVLFGGYGVAVSSHYAFVAAQGCLSGQPCPTPTVGDAFVVVDVADPAHPAVAASIRNSALPAPFTGTNALKHATSVAISGNFAYVTAAYSNRLTVIDISNPTSPVIVASLLDGTQLNFPVDVAAQGNLVYVVDQITQGRLTVVDVSTPSTPHVVGSVVSNAWLNGAYRVRLRGNFAFASGVNGDTVAAVDISDPTAPRVAGGYTSPAVLNRTTGLDVDSSGRYVIANSPYLSTETNPTFPPYPFQTGGPTQTGTISSVDVTPAPISISLTGSSLPANPTTVAAATFAFTVNDSVSTVRCSLDGAPFDLCTGPTTQVYNSLSVGDHTFSVQAIDPAGATSSDSYSWTINSPGPAAPTTPVLDDFNRANGSAGAHWSLIRPGNTFAAMKIVGNAALDNSTSAFAWNFWNPSSFGPDAEAYVTVKTYGASDVIRVGARVSGGSPAYDGYYVTVSATGAWSLLRIDNGSATTLTSGPTQALASGDKLGIRIVGSVVTGLHDTPSGGWVEVLSYDTTQDATRYTAAGSIALEFKTSTLDDFGGGTITAANAPPVNTSLPTISGSATVGQQLTASPGSWTGSPPPTFTYQWIRCDNAGANCNPIGSATATTYTLAAADQGNTIAVAVTGTNTVGNATATSATTAVIQAAGSAPVNTVLPSISGSTSVGQQLTAAPGSWTGTPAPTFSYQWIRCDNAGANCNPIGSATATTYTLVGADQANTVAVAVTGANTAGNSTATSDLVGPVSTAPAPPVNTSLPTISGSATVGQQLTASPGSWTGSPAPTFTYQWLRCDNAGANCNPIGSATASTYTLAGADQANTVAVAVTGSNASGNATATSQPTAVIQAAGSAPVNTVLPSISGSATVGQQLTASPGSWTGSPAPTFTYQWIRCDNAGANCNQINGETSSTYTLIGADGGNKLAVAVTGSNTSGNATATSSLVGPVNAAPVNTVLPSISGSATVGQQLTASPGSWTGSPAPTFSYQWIRCDNAGANCNPIGSATATTYTLAAADQGNTIAVAVTGTNTVGNATATSATTAVIQGVSLAPTTPVLDNFNRANGSAGANWSLIKPGNGFAAMKITGNAAQDSATNGTFAWNFWNPSTFGPDSEAYVTINTYIAGDVIRLGARVTGGTTAYSGYYVMINASGGWTIIRFDNGGSPTTLATGPTQPLASSDKIAIRIIGSTVTALHFTTGGGWVQVLSYDTSGDAIRYTAAGSLAIEFKSSTLDDFGGGTISAANASPVNTVLPTISGPTTVGQQLTASPGSWTGSPAPTFTYQWLRCDNAGANCNPIGSATASTYTLAGADQANTVAVAVTGSNASGNATATSQPTAVIQAAGSAPVNTVLPSISGSATVGQQLTASPGSWTGSPAPTFTYQWIRCDNAGANCNQINGETSSTYTLIGADGGNKLAVAVTGSNTSGNATATSSLVGPVNAAPVNTVLPSISGSATVGQQLTASPGSWTGSPAPTFSYQWIRCDNAGANCNPIGSATATTYTLAAADQGNTIAVAVTGTNTVGNATATSATTAVIQGVSLAPTTPVLDNFNRANGSAGANWSLIKPGNGFAAMKITGNAAQDSATNGTFAWNFWNPSTFGPDSEAYVTINTYIAGDVIRLGARVTGGTTAYSGYYVMINASGGWTIIRFDNGGSPTTLATGPTQPLASSDKIAIRIIGSTVTALHFTTGGGWVQVLSYDTSGDAIRYTAAGSLAIEFKSSTLDDFGGGSLP